MTGDSCWSVRLEARVDGTLFKRLDQQQFYAFADYGKVYRLAPAAGTPITQDGASVGLGMRLAKGALSTDLVAAKPIFGRTNDSWRFFMTATARY